MQIVTLIVAALVMGDGTAVPEESLTKLVDDKVLEILRTSDRLEAMRIDPEDHSTTDEEGDRVSGYRITARAPVNSTGFAKNFGKVFTREDSYVLGLERKCKFQPGVVFRFVKKDAHVDAIVCYECDTLRLRGSWQNLKDAVPLNCDAMRTRLVVQARRAFPQDAVLENLRRLVRIENLVDQSSRRILASVTRIETYRIHPEFRRDAEDKILNYEILARGSTLEGPEVVKLGSQLLEKDNFMFDARKTCAIRPGVVFRVYRDEAFVDIVICFECEMLGFYSGPSKNPRRMWEDFDPIHDPILRLAKKAFPDDSTIQDL